MVLDISNTGALLHLNVPLKKTRQTIKSALSRSSFAQMLINLKLFADCAYLSVKQTFEFYKHSKLKRRDISYWCYQILYTCTMYFQGRRNTCNMLRREKCGRALTKYIKQKCFVGVRYQNVTKLLDASDQRDSCGCASPHHFPIFISCKYIFAIQTAWNLARVA